MNPTSTLLANIWAMINSSPVSSVIKDSYPSIVSNSFKSLPDHILTAINAETEFEMKQNWHLYVKNFDTVDDVRTRAASLGGMLAAYHRAGTVVKTIDNIVQRNVTPAMSSSPWGMSMGFGMQPLWIAPGEAAVIYSGKGIPELIIEKKSHSPLLNGISIKNPKLSPEQLDRVQNDITRLSFDMKIAETIRDSLVFGGSIIFPRFKKDSPATMWMPVSQLLRYGILEKDSIERFTTLDRWNVVFTPDWNPVNNAFQNPPFYFVPFLGSILSSQRCSRVITSPAAGYWGTLITLGWGVSDIPGWYESVMNYESVIAAVPFMIKQMSLLARVWDSSGMSSIEGLSLLDSEAAEATIRNRGTGPDTIVNLDVVGDLKAINRDFAHVPELIRLLRQDTAAKARYPEELIWSSERGAFSSGDTSDSAWEKQTENVRYTHIKVGFQLKQLAMIFVINSLGATNDVMKALPYTSIDFDNPKLTNAKDKAEIGKNISQSIFDDVAAGMPVDMAVEKAKQLSDKEFNLSATFMQELKDRQRELDEFEREKRKLELEKLEAEIEVLKAKATAPMGMGMGGSGTGVSSSSSTGKGGGHSYSDPLEQKKHETIGSNRGGARMARAGKK